jgi:hypothetical protein
MTLKGFENEEKVEIEVPWKKHEDSIQAIRSIIYKAMRRCAGA